MRLRLLALLCALGASGCGVPQELPKQAEEVASVAAEGSLLAHDAAEGGTTETFTREHARALRRRLRELRPAIEHRELAVIAQDVDRMLEGLAQAYGDRLRISLIEHDLDYYADAAGDLAG